MKRAVLCMFLMLAIPGLSAQAEEQVAVARLTVDAGKGLVVDAAQGRPESLEVVMRRVFVQVSMADFDAIVDLSVEALVKADKNPEARLVRDLAVKIKAVDEAGVTVSEPPLDFRIRTEIPASAS